MTLTRTSIIKISSLIGLVVLLTALVVRGEVGSTEATYYHTGGLDLKIDSRTYYNNELQPSLSWKLKDLKPWKDHFFDFDDVKPGDTGTNTISLHLKKNAGYVCLDFENLEDFENGINEPEGLLDDDNDGELSDELQFFAWRDDGDNEYEPGEQPLFGVGTAASVLKGQSYAIADKTTPAPLWPYQTYYIGLYWCAGDLEIDLATGAVSCDATAMGNEAQTDSMTLDVSLRAVVAKQMPWFTCVKPDPVPDPCEDTHGNNGHGNDDDHNDDSNPGQSNDDDDDTDDDGTPGHSSFLFGSWDKKDKDKDPCKEDHGNNGHGNDDDHNDDSNPGQSNDDDDDTDDDGTPGNGNQNGGTAQPPQDEQTERDGHTPREPREQREQRQQNEPTETASFSVGQDWRFELADVRPLVTNKFREVFGRGNRI